MMNDVIPVPGPIQRRQQKQAPLTYAQESLWFLQQLDPGSNAYNTTHLIKFTGGIDHPCMERAVNELIRRHEPLRTLYPNIRGKPIQVVQPYEHYELPYIKFQGISELDWQRASTRFVTEQGDIPFNLQRGHLFRFALINRSATEDELFFCTHHIGSDAWSWQILLRELLTLYQSYRSGKEVPLPDLPFQYTDYAIWQREWLSGETLAVYLTHWKKILSGDLPILDLPTDKPRPDKQSFRGDRFTFRFSDILAVQIHNFCLSERVTPFHLFLAVYAVFLMRYSGQEDIIIGCPFANRQSLELNSLVGLLVNTLPVRVDLSGNPTVSELLNQVRETMLDSFSWQAAPFEALVSELSPERDLSRTPVFQVAINMRNVPKQTQVLIDALEMEEILREDAPIPFDLSIEFNNSKGFFDVSFRYNVDLFTEETIIQMTSHYQTLLGEFLVKGGAPIASLEMLSPSETKTLIGYWEHPRSDVPKTSIHELISRQAHKNPNANAVICNGRSMTYLALEKKSNQLAAYLQVKGVVPGSLVGILLPRSEDLLVTQLAILKTGGVYVYYDRDYPSERLAYMVMDSNPILIVTHSSVYSNILNGYQSVNLDDDSSAICTYPEGMNFPGTGEDKPLYVSYTSGSTGRPKGVITLQRGILNYIQFLIRDYHLNGGERVIQFTSLSFDPSFRDTLGVLTLGCTVFLMDDNQMRDAEFITRTIVEQKIDCILSVVPTMLRALTGVTGLKQTRENRLRLIMPSGEVLQPADVDSVRNTFGSGVKIVNQYGPTECSMASTTYPVPDDIQNDAREIPIGKQIDNVYFYVLDTFHHLVPPGVKGELYIGGVGLSSGYLNQPDLTNERFISDPFRSGERIYRTGDLVRMAPDGNLLYLGRMDHQVKIRGYRVELGEIESVVLEYPGIQEVAVVLSPQDGMERLSAYITLSKIKNGFKNEGLHQYLKERLPFYMLPSTITLLKKMPLTSTGKIDRHGLPNPSTGQAKARYIAPRNEVEKWLVSIWQEVIGIDRVGIRDNYFELGGHSLMAVRLFSRIQQEFGRSLPLTLLFQVGTVEAIADALTMLDKSKRTPGITLLGQEGTRVPLFIISASLETRDLVLSMSSGRPIYSLDPVIDGRKTFKRLIQETAGIYYQNLVNFYPQGPYLLLGHSGFGLFALEIARLLIENNKEVAFLGMLDTYPPGSGGVFVNPIDQVKTKLKFLKGKTVIEILQYPRRSIMKLLTRWGIKLKVNERKLNRFAQQERIKDLMEMIMREYRMETYSGNVTLFWATERPRYRRGDPYDQWKKYITGQLDVLPVVGDHSSILHSPNSDVLARMIESIFPKSENG